MPYILIEYQLSVSLVILLTCDAALVSRHRIAGTKIAAL